MKKKTPIIFLLIVLSAFSTAFAQSNITQSPYTDGETLTYDGKVSKAIIRGLNVADVNFSVSLAPNKKDYIVDAQAISKGSLLSLFRFKFLEKISSTVDGKTYSILRSVKRDEQGDRVRDSEANFDYIQKTVTYVETDPNDTARPPRRIASSIENNTYDLVSGVYAMRRLPLAVGKTFYLNVSDSGLVYKVPVRVTARELQSSVLGKKNCFRIEPDIFGDGRMIEQKGNMILWITDDERRVPIRAQINTGIGRIEVKLRKAEIKKP